MSDARAGVPFKPSSPDRYADQSNETAFPHVAPAGPVSMFEVVCIDVRSHLHKRRSGRKSSWVVVTIAGGTRTTSTVRAGQYRVNPAERFLSTSGPVTLWGQSTTQAARIASADPLDTAPAPMRVLIRRPSRPVSQLCDCHPGVR